MKKCLLLSALLGLFLSLTSRPAFAQVRCEEEFQRLSAKQLKAVQAKRNLGAAFSEAPDVNGDLGFSIRYGDLLIAFASSGAGHVVKYGSAFTPPMIYITPGFRLTSISGMWPRSVTITLDQYGSRPDLAHTIVGPSVIKTVDLTPFLLDSEFDDPANVQRNNADVAERYPELRP